MKKRLNSKKRKLNEIRLSNRIKSGLPVFAYAKVSDLYAEDTEYLTNIVNSIKPKTNIPRLDRKFKFKIILTEMQATCEDMSKNIFTIRNKYIALL